jgi:hypothetical protein
MMWIKTGEPVIVKIYQTPNQFYGVWLTWKFVGFLAHQNKPHYQIMLAEGSLFLASNN